MKILNQQIMKNYNLKKVFSLIMAHKMISRIELAAMTSLSKTTISSLVDELIQGGFVVDEGLVATGRQGRKPSLLRVNAEDNIVAVINWHVDELEVSLVDMAGKVVSYEVCPLVLDAAFDQVIPEVYYSNLVEKAGKRNILGLCLVVPSMLDAASQRMISTVLPIPEGDDVLERICGRITGVPMAVFNDTACYAYAEHTLTDWDFQTFLFININNGIGAVIVHDGKMIKGEAGLRPQLGHFSLNRNGDPCMCGGRGCLENEIGETALIKRAKAAGLYETLEKHGAITFAALGKQADDGDPAARTFVKGLAEDLAFVLDNVLVIYNTDHIIIGGKGQRLGTYYLEQLEAAMKKAGFRIVIDRADLMYTALGDDAIMRGAARYFIDEYYKFFEDMTDFLVLE